MSKLGITDSSSDVDLTNVDHVTIRHNPLILEALMWIIDNTKISKLSGVKVGQVLSRKIKEELNK